MLVARAAAAAAAAATFGDAAWAWAWAGSPFLPSLALFFPPAAGRLLWLR